MNIQVDSTSSNLASVMLNSKIRPRAVVGYGPPNYVSRSPGIALIRDHEKVRNNPVNTGKLYFSYGIFSISKHSRKYFSPARPSKLEFKCSFIDSYVELKMPVTCRKLISCGKLRDKCVTQTINFWLWIVMSKLQ